MSLNQLINHKIKYLIVIITLDDVSKFMMFDAEGVK